MLCFRGQHQTGFNSRKVNTKRDLALKSVVCRERRLEPSLQDDGKAVLADITFGGNRGVWLEHCVRDLVVEHHVAVLNEASDLDILYG